MRSVHVLADDGDLVAVLDARVDTTRLPSTNPAPSAPRMRGLGTDGRPLRIQRSRWLSEAARSSTSTSPGARLGIGRVLVAEYLGPAVLVDPDRLHRRRSPCNRVLLSLEGAPSRHNAIVTTAELERIAAELGIDVVGAAPAEAYEATERHIAERKERGPLRRHAVHDGAPRGLVPPGDAAPERADRRLRRALLLRATSRAPGPGEGRLPRYTWFDAYAELREKLDALGRRLGGEYRVLVDENDHVDREGAVRSGVGFYGKNTMLITRRHGSWVVLGTLVTDAEIERSAPLELDCGSCTLCIEACPTGALDEPGTLDSTRCLSYWTQAPGSIPEEYRERARSPGLRLRHLPGRLPVEPRDREAPRGRGSARRRASRTSRSSSGSRPATRSCATRYERLYFPRKDPRYLRRNALVAAGNARRPGRCAKPSRPTRGNGDPLLREHAEWALARLDEARRECTSASAAGELERWISVVRLDRGPVGPGRGRPRHADYRIARYETAAWVVTGVLAVGAIVFFWARPAARVAAGCSPASASPGSRSTRR